MKAVLLGGINESIAKVLALADKAAKKAEIATNKALAANIEINAESRIQSLEDKAGNDMCRKRTFIIMETRMIIELLLAV